MAAGYTKRPEREREKRNPVRVGATVAGAPAVGQGT